VTESQRPQPIPPPRRKVPSSSVGGPYLPGVGDDVAGLYRVVRRIGRGGFGAVYHACRLGTGVDCALKILDPQLATDPVQSERFRREALLASSLSHPNTIRLHDYGKTSTGLMYMAMELLEGQSLASALELNGPMPLREAAHITMQILESLTEAHALRLIHRDLKPANIFLCTTDSGLPFVKVLDFGVAISLTSLSNRLTKQGEVLGTIAYMAPEQTSEQHLTPATDIYAVGLLLYQMLAGSSPYLSMGEHEIVTAKLEGHPLPNVRAFPEALRDSLMPIIAQATASDHRVRYRDAMSFYAALAALDGVSDGFHVVNHPHTHRDPRQRIEELTALGQRAADAGATADALALFRQASAMLSIHGADLPPDHPVSPRVYLALARSCVAVGDYGAAEDALARALDGLPPASPERLDAHLQMAHVLEGLERSNEASFHLLAVLHFAEDPSVSRFHAMLGLARDACSRADRAEALEFARQARSNAHALGLTALGALATLEIARVLSDAGELHQALDQLRTALAGDRDVLGAPLERALLELAAALDTRLGDTDAARNRLLEALNTGHAQHDPTSTVALHIALARNLALSHDFDSATDTLHKAITLASLRDLPRYEIDARLALIELSAAQLGLDDPGVGRNIQELLAILQRLDDPLGLARTLNAVAEVAMELQQLHTAEHYLELSLETQQNAQLWKVRPHTLRGLARVAERRGNLEEALSLLDNALAAAIRVDDALVIADLKLDQARALITLGHLPRARALLVEVSEAARRHNATAIRACASAGLDCVARLYASPPVEDTALIVLLNREPMLAAIACAWLDAIPVARAHPGYRRQLAAALDTVRSTLCGAMPTE